MQIGVAAALCLLCAAAVEIESTNYHAMLLNNIHTQVKYVLLACLCQVFHVGRFDVHDIEALIRVVKMPQVYSQVITGNEGFLVTADGDSIDVVCVGIAKHTLTSGLHDLFHICDLQGKTHSSAYPACSDAHSSFECLTFKQCVDLHA